MRLPPAFARGAAILAASVALVSLRAESPPPAETWLTQYYLDPQPEQFIPAIFELSRAGWFEQPGHVPLAIGFVASVFQQNPESVDGWLLHCRALPPVHQRLIIAALWYSGHAKGPVYLAAYSRITGAEVRDRLDRVLASPPALEGAAVVSRSSALLQWGVFLATGEAAPVRSNLAALRHQGRVAGDIRALLVQHVGQHARVREICRGELPRQPDEVREGLRRVIESAVAGGPAASL